MPGRRWLWALGALPILVLILMALPANRARREALFQAGEAVISGGYHPAMAIQVGGDLLHARHNVAVIARAAEYVTTFGSNTTVFRRIARIAAQADGECPRLERVLDLAARKRSESGSILRLAETACSLEDPEREARWEEAYGILAQRAEYPSVEAALEAARRDRSSDHRDPG